jgi:asparagine synthase (glutamine-hydrolysing)
LDPACTAVWLSGGYDSTAVFAAGQEWLRRSGQRPDALRAVSVSYPEGDPGREDELIREVTTYWGVPATWVNSDDVPILRDPWLSAADRDEPWAHPFEEWNRALAVASRKAGATRALTGSGGDQLFASPIGQFSDLFWHGRWRLLRREWLERRGKGLGLFARAAILPGLPRSAYRVARVLRGGRRLYHYLDRNPPPWFRDSFLRDHDLFERQWNERRWVRPGHASEGEMAFYFRTAYAPRVAAAVRALAADEALGVAAPLLDRRVVELAAGRPGEERSRGLETKRLLREAMRGLLPEGVLAPRSEKTGLTVGYFERAFRSDLGLVLARFGGRNMRLAELGIVDPVAFQQAADRYLKSRDPSRGLALYLTLQAELWLRARPDLTG